MRRLFAVLGATLAATTLTAGIAPVALAAPQASIAQDSSIACYGGHHSFKVCVENNKRTWNLDKRNSSSSVVGRIRDNITLRFDGTEFTLTGCGDVFGTYSLDGNLRHIATGHAALHTYKPCSDMEKVAMKQLQEAFDAQYIPASEIAIGRMTLDTSIGKLAFRTS